MPSGSNFIPLNWGLVFSGANISSSPVGILLWPLWGVVLSVYYDWLTNTPQQDRHPIPQTLWLHHNTCSKRCGSYGQATTNLRLRPWNARNDLDCSGVILTVILRGRKLGQWLGGDWTKESEGWGDRKMQLQAQECRRPLEVQQGKRIVSGRSQTSIKSTNTHFFLSFPRGAGRILACGECPGFR